MSTVTKDSSEKTYNPLITEMFKDIDHYVGVLNHQSDVIETRREQTLKLQESLGVRESSTLTISWLQRLLPQFGKITCNMNLSDPLNTKLLQPQSGVKPAIAILSHQLTIRRMPR